MTFVSAFSRVLADSFSDLLVYGVTFCRTAGEKQLPYEEVRAEVLRLLKASEAIATQANCPMEDYDVARYAVCAWLDEAILSSTWTAKARWRHESLQRHFYQSADAGEKFFQRLKNLEPQEQGIREVYYLCLALGFKGRYCAPDDVYALEQLKERHLKLLFNSVAETPTVAVLEKNVLFPEAYSQARAKGDVKKMRSASLWKVALAAPAFLFVVLFFTYRFTLMNVGESILKAVRS